MSNKKGVSEKQRERALTANEITDVKDIKNNLLYTKSGYIIGFLRLYPINIELLSRDEMRNICNLLTGEFKSEKEPFTILSIPRTVDMEVYLNFLADISDQEIDNPYRKMLLNDMIMQGSRTVTNGKNYEHQFYIKVWTRYKENVTGSEEIIEEKINDMISRYSAVQNLTKRLDDTEILKLCNLFGNSNTAVLESYDSNNVYIPIPILARRKEKYEKE